MNNTIYVVNPDNRNPHLSPKWPGVLHKKIDVFINEKYIHSTNAYVNTKKAILGAAHERNISAKEIKAHYSK